MQIYRTPRLSCQTCIQTTKSCFTSGTVRDTGAVLQNVDARSFSTTVCWDQRGAASVGKYSYTAGSSRHLGLGTSRVKFAVLRTSGPLDVLSVCTALFHPVRRATELLE